MSAFALRNVLITVWHVPPTAALVGRLVQVSQPVRDFSVQGMSMVHLVKAPLSAPDEATRTAMLRMVSSHNVGLVAMLVNQSGFVLSVVRSVVTGMRVLSAGRFDYRICSTVEEVAEWMPELHQRKTGIALDQAQLLRALHEANASAP